METNLAVLIDFENIAAGTEKEGLGRFDVDTLMQRIKDKGRILVARSLRRLGPVQPLQAEPAAPRT